MENPIIGGGYTCSECGQYQRTSAVCNHFNLIDSNVKNNVEKPLKEMSLNDAIEYLKQNPKESVKITLSEDERNDINEFFKNYEVKRKYKKDNED
jgi:hypothetical protein